MKKFFYSNCCQSFPKDLILKEKPCCNKEIINVIGPTGPSAGPTGATGYSMRQAGYFNPNSTGYVTHIVVFNTRGWVVDQALMQFSGNSWGSSENAVDIALLSGTTSEIPYDSVTDLENNNSSATVSDQR